ncbi:MAG: hypothetical protein ACTHKL_08055, partial [Streptosporangiaceae bacterium]
FAVASAASPFSVQPQWSWQMTVYAAGAAIVAAAAVWQLYRATAVRRPGNDDPEIADLGGPR